MFPSRFVRVASGVAGTTNVCVWFSCLLVHSWSPQQRL